MNHKTITINIRLLDNIEAFIAEQTRFAKRNGRDAFEDGTDLAKALTLLNAVTMAGRKENENSA